MKPINWRLVTLLFIPCWGLLLLMLAFGTSIASRAGSRSAKCTVDIADAKGSVCALVKANDEWILWSNTSSKPLSVHFKPSENPFMEKSCWDVDAGARARSGPATRAAAPKTYLAYSSAVSCGANPSSDTGHIASKVTIQ
jgi:hypothetical protein